MARAYNRTSWPSNYKNKKRKYSTLKCKTPWCTNKLLIFLESGSRRRFYCNDCKKQHEFKILELQSYHNLTIKEVLIEAAKMFNFKSLSATSAYLDSKLKTVRAWIRHYFNVDWPDFKRVYYCEQNTCEEVDVSYVKNKYYLSKKLRRKGVCNCWGKDGLVCLVKNLEDRQYIDKLLME